MLHKISVVGGILLVIWNFPAIAQNDPANDRLLASQCAQCHGTNGYAVGEMDEIAGEDAKDLFEDLRDMRREDRPENIMDHQALGYTEAQILRIAHYYSTLPEEQKEEREEKEKEDEDEKEEKDEDDDD